MKTRQIFFQLMHSYLALYTPFSLLFLLKLFELAKKWLKYTWWQVLILFWLSNEISIASPTNCTSLRFVGISNCFLDAELLLHQCIFEEICHPHFLVYNPFFIKISTLSDIYSHSVKIISFNKMIVVFIVFIWFVPKVRGYKSELVLSSSCTNNLLI